MIGMFSFCQRLERVEGRGLLLLIRLRPGNDYERLIVGAVARGKLGVRFSAKLAEAIDLGLRENLSREAH